MIFFFNESLCRTTLENIGREVAPQRFLFQSKSASHTEVTPLCFYFRTHFPFSRYRRGQRSRHVLFSLHIRHPTRATRERNSTAPAPFSPSLLDEVHSLHSKFNHCWDQVDQSPHTVGKHLLDVSGNVSHFQGHALERQP